MMLKLVVATTGNPWACRGDVPTKTWLVLSLLGVEDRAQLKLMTLGLSEATEAKPR